MEHEHSNIHTTNPGADGEESRNYQGLREAEIESGAEPQPTQKSNKKGAMFAFIYFGAMLLVLMIVGVVMYVVWGGTTNKATVKVDPNKPNLVNSNLSPDETYDQATKILNVNSNTGVQPAATPSGAPGTIAGVPNGATPGGSLITDPALTGGVPPPNPNGLIYTQPGTPLPSPSPAKSEVAGNNRKQNGGGNGGGNAPSWDDDASNDPLSDGSGGNRSGASRGNDGRARTNYVGYASDSAAENDQRSLYFYSRSGATGVLEQAGNRNSASGSGGSLIAAPVKLPFGEMLPVRFNGALHSLGTGGGNGGGLTRMQLARAVKGNGYYLPKDTVFVGRVSGSQANRIFVQLVGYIDPRSGQLVRVGGDVLGTDEALGIAGDRKKLGSFWKDAGKMAFSAGRDFVNSYLLGRRGGGGAGGVVLTPNVLNSANSPLSEERDTNHFVVTRAGAYGYLIVNDLPAAVEGKPPRSEEEFYGQAELTPEQQIALLQSESPALIRQNLSRLSPGLRALAEQSLNK